MKAWAGVAAFLWAGACWAQSGGRGGGEPGKPVEVPKCDLKKLDKGKFCETCVKLREKEELQDGWTCKDCTKKVKECEVCIKDYWECSKCKSVAFKEGHCAADCCKADKVKLEKKTSKCRVIYRCKGTCMATFETKKKCDNKECSGKGKDFEKSCEESGRPPHVKNK